MGKAEKTSRIPRNNPIPQSLKTNGPTLNKVLGQHILKNPLVVNGIIDKVCICDPIH
jgi:hypothetical protein